MSHSLIGVVGAGVMGTGVAQNLAQTGHRVVLIDLTDEKLSEANAEIRRGIRLQSLLGKGGPPTPAGSILSRITFSTEYDELEKVDYVIENVTESWRLKKQIYPRLDRICRKSVVFAANTSAIPITRIASATRRPDRVIGVHFMNPVPLKPAVEVIPGFHTSEDTVETTRELLTRMGKTSIRVSDSPGFVSNRVLMLTINEAIFLLHDGVASASDVDKVFTSCFGHPMGPLATADLIGLDTILQSIEVLQDAFGDDKYRPCPLLKQMVDAGLLGKKTRRGFFEYGRPASIGPPNRQEQVQNAAG